MGFTAVIIPATGRLDLQNSTIEIFRLTLDFEMDRTTNRRNRVEVLKLDLGPERVACTFSQRNVHIATKLTLLHVGIGNVTLLEDHLQRAQIREGLFGRLEVRLGNNFHQGRAGTIEIDER